MPGGPNWPVARKAPVREADNVSPSGPPVTENGSRVMVQVISALVMPGGAGISGFPDIVGGIAVSIAAWITVSGMMTGVTMSELRVTGGSGGTSARAGGRSTEAGARNFTNQTAPPATGTATRSRVSAVLRKARFMQRPSPLPRTRTYRKGSNAANHAQRGPPRR
jgi:hypothetical protein